MAHSKQATEAAKRIRKGVADYILRREKRRMGEEYIAAIIDEEHAELRKERDSYKEMAEKFAIADRTRRQQGGE